MSFESDLKRMEEITQLLKNPETGLEKSIELYEEGSRLAKELSRTLDQIQRKVEKVTSIDENELETVDLDDEGNEEKDVF
ncbi:MAG: exodeoxyribonuclease VII small subunit [Candidatus Ornithospirochaeta sp.]